MPSPNSDASALHTSSRIFALSRRDVISLGLVLSLALVIGTFRIAIAPLWAHYDEQAHYAYLRFIVVNRRLPTPLDDLDAETVARIESTFSPEFELIWREICPPETAPQIICLHGPTNFYQFSHQPPGYYAIQAVIHGLVRPQNIYQEVLLARSISVLLAVGVAGLAFYIMRLIFPAIPLLSVGVPLLMSLNIHYADYMSGIQNEVLAIFAVTLVTLALIAMLRLGVTPLHGGLLLIGLILCLISKYSAWIMFPATALAVLIWLWPRLALWLKAAAILLIIVVGLALMDWRNAAAWTKHEMYNSVNRAPAVDAPDGNYVLVVTDQPAPSFLSGWLPIQQAPEASWARYRGHTDPYLLQVIPEPLRSDLRGRRVTLGVWLRSPLGETTIVPPTLWNGAARTPEPSYPVEPEWTYYTTQAEIPPDQAAMVVRLNGRLGARIEYDNIILVAGDVSSSPGGDSPNLIRNGSAELPWPLLYPEVDSRIQLNRLNLALQSIEDIHNSWQYYMSALRWLAVTFWAAYLAGIPALGAQQMLPFAALSGLAFLGLLWALVKEVRRPCLELSQRQMIVLFVFLVLAAVLLALAWADPVNVFGVFQEHSYLPTARHIYIVVVPAYLFFLLGVGQFVPKRWHRYGLAALLLLMFVMNLYSLFSVQIPGYRALPTVF